MTHLRLAVATGLCLAFVNHVTKQPIEARMKADIEQKKRDVLPAAQSFEEIPAAEAADETGIVSSASKAKAGGAVVSSPTCVSDFQFSSALLYASIFNLHFASEFATLAAC